jgi:uncharacterized protein
MSSNQLKNETSPYLLQHADNPVNWYPWGEEALRLAREQNKPILLSIGYSACHWCHVMAHESFEDSATADVMNELFINIKVDREERPDIDKIYQTAQYLLTQRTGGWPLTMFLTPDDQMPFFGGTYFPDKPRHNLPGFKDLLRHVSKAHDEKHEQISTQNDSLRGVLANVYGSTEVPLDLDSSMLERAAKQLLEQFDKRHGGFGPAPKFPHPANLQRLMREWYHSERGKDEERDLLHPALYTLERMAAGGLFDHVGGGFCRYSVDEYWMIPHFEKMLYDNGPLLSLCAEAYQLEARTDFKQTALDTADWVMSDMQSETGGYYSSRDADSEGEEGKFYVWETEELQQLLTEDEYAVAAQRFDFLRGPNFEGSYHLHEFNPFNEVAETLGIEEEVARQRWQRAKEKLFKQRQLRIAPGRDDKILTSWNALMIRGMVITARVFEKPELHQSALRAIDFIQGTLLVDGRLLATYKDGKAHLNAYLDDYAYLLDALLETIQAQWNSGYLNFAIQLAEVLLEQFEDKTNGGFYFTANDHENLIERPKVSSDEATPAGNGIAASALLRLGYLLAEPRYIEAAERTLGYASQQISNSPMAHGSVLHCLEEIEKPSKIVVLRGPAADIAVWQKRLQDSFRPDLVSLAIADDEQDLHPALASKEAGEQVRAYLCIGTQCLPAIDNLEQLITQLAPTP